MHKLVLLFFVALSFIRPLPALSIIAGDANSDGIVDGLDYVVWLNYYNKPVQGHAYGDFNMDGVADGLDYVVWLNNYLLDNTSLPTSSPVPTVTEINLPAFPGAEGFGASSKGGRGGQALRVTNLSDSGTGSLRSCVEAGGPRYCIFDVSGTISLNNTLSVNDPYLTIAGESAPSPGITLKGDSLDIKASDIIIRHIRIRVGNRSASGETDLDGLSILGPDSKRVIIDHVSISWAVDENLSTWTDGVSDVTVSNSIISEALHNSTHSEGPHSKGFLIGDYAKNVALIDSVFAHNQDRHPLIKGGTTSIILNNLFYNFGQPYGARIGSSDSVSAGPVLTTIRGNVYLNGPDTPEEAVAVSLSDTASGSKWFTSDNLHLFPGLVSNTNTLPVWLENLTPDQPEVVESLLLPKAGARPKDRDAVDTRIISEIQGRTGKIINDVSEVGGWPVLAQNSRTFPVPASPNGDDDADGYTNLEEILHQYAAQLQ